MKQLYQLILLLFVCCSSIIAQEKIVAYEYWLDNDYTSKQSTQITPVQTFKWQTTIPCQHLDVGLHSLNLRFKDSKGYWSSPVSSFFYKTEEPAVDNEIVLLEYWLDGNYGEKKTIQPAKSSAVQWSIDIPYQDLEQGIHTFSAHFKDTKGHWSSTVSSYFYKVANLKSDNSIVAYEYWLDESKERKTEKINSPNQIFNLSTVFSGNELASGIHSFHIRFQDKYAQWSSTVSRQFLKIPVPIDNRLVAYEYWINEGYDKKQSGAIGSEKSFIIADSIDCSAAIEATNYIHYRFKDKTGKWSSVLSKDFYRPIEPAFTSIAGLSEITFTNTSKYADKYEWEFGDGNTSDQVNPLHTYAEPGAYLVKLTAKNKEFTDTIKQYVEVEGIKKISNNRGGNDGRASFDIYGGGLTENTVVKLVKDGVTISTYSVYQKEPGVICATFDLTNKTMGVYDIVVSIDGKDHVINDGFTIEEVNYPQAFAEIEGNNVFIPGRWQTYTVNYGNAGNTDIYGLPINLIFSNNSDCEFAFDLIDGINGINSDDYVVLTSITSELFGGKKIEDVYSSITNPADIISLSTEIFDGKMYSVFIPHIPANTRGSFSFRLKVNTSQATKMYVNTGEILNDIYFNTQAENIENSELFGYWLTQTFNIKKETLSKIIRDEINKSFTSQQTTSQKQFVNFVTLINESDCFSSASNLRSSNSIIRGPISECDVWYDAIAYLDKQLEANGCGAADGMKFPDFGIYKDACNWHDIGYATCGKSKIETDIQFFYDMCESCCAKYPNILDTDKRLACIAGATAYYEAVLYGGLGAYYSAQKLACQRDDYKRKQALPCPVPTETTPQISYDPNEIIGTSGYGEENYIQPKGYLNYTVYFENDAEKATAPAQEILVTDTLDLTRFNPEIFSFGTFTFRDVTIEATPGVTEFSQDVDMRPQGEDIIVRIQATFNKTTGEVRCYMIALDPVTMDLTENPSLGILYPNIAPPIGDGNFTYRIGLRQDLPHGTVVSNQAGITFDLNKPIETNVFVNTLDMSSPVSHISPTYQVENDSVITLSWLGEDTGSGVSNYTVYVSENDGDYYSWLLQTNETSGKFEGKPGNSYRFFVVAADYVGNSENKDKTAELTVDLDGLGIENTKSTHQALTISPNPVEHTATITLNIKESSDVKIVLYNLSGQQVSIVYNQYTTPGEKEILLDASNLSSGVYTLEMQTKDDNIVKRVLVK